MTFTKLSVSFISSIAMIYRVPRRRPLDSNWPRLAASTPGAGADASETERRALVHQDEREIFLRELPRPIVLDDRDLAERGAHRSARGVGHGQSVRASYRT